MSFDSLHVTLGSIHRPVEMLHVTDSLQRAASVMQASGFAGLPVTGPGGVVGLVTEHAIAKAMEAGLEPTSAVGIILSQSPPALPAHASGAEALRLLSEGNWPFILVADRDSNIVGVVAVTDLAMPKAFTPRPRLVGGMATPFGVYLTSGSLRAGAKGFPLVVTGALLLALFIFGSVLARESVMAVHLRWVHIPVGLMESLVGILSTGVFLLGMRSLPIAGIHAAEHMTVHAIERGEPLVMEVVKRMPRVHPRCGTNLAVGATIFLGIGTANWFNDATLQLMLAAVAAAILWRPIGSWVQYWITTRPPTDAQIRMGIRAGEELLEHYRNNPAVHASPLTRIRNSGMLHLMSGSFALVLLVDGVSRLVPGLGFLRVYS